MFRKTLVLSAVAVAALVMAAAASAAAPTIRLGDAQLIGKVAITVPVSVSCAPPEGDRVLQTTSLSVSVQQAAGKEIAYGSGFVGGFNSMAFTCDGSEQTVPVTISANPSGAPFHGGKIVVTASAFASTAEPCFPGATDCFTNFASEGATIGPVAVHL
jgi:hypothetical protein